MQQALNIVAPTRRGACPTLDKPMQTGDGLLARVRVADGRLTPDQLGALARLAASHGNGIIEISARANLQVRGLTSSSAPLFAKAVASLLPIVTGLVIDTSPLAGDDPEEKADPQPLVHAIALGAQAFNSHLGPKVSVVVDADGQVSLAAIKADVRLLALAADSWAVFLGGGKPQVMTADGAVAATLALLGAVAANGPDARALDLFPSTPEGKLARAEPHRGLPLQLRHGHTVPIALPFGAADAAQLSALAEAANRGGITTIRLAPAHTLLLDDASLALVAEAQALGFITEGSDPRRSVSACIGSAGCASGHIPARSLAARFAAHLPQGQRLHVSGCSKGCAHPAASAVTLVGRSDGIGLVIDGRAGDTPHQIVDEAGALAALVLPQEAR